MTKVYKVVEISNDSDTITPIEYVGVPVTRWGSHFPTVAFVEAAPYPDTSPLNILFGVSDCFDECPACGDEWHGKFHKNGMCDFYNRMLDAEDCLKRINNYKP